MQADTSEVHIEHNIEVFTVKTNSIFKEYTNLDRLKIKGKAGKARADQNVKTVT